MMRGKIIICFVVLSCLLGTIVLIHYYREILNSYENSAPMEFKEYSWIYRLILNLAGYATVLLPMFIIYKYLERIKYFDKIPSPSVWARVVRTCFGDGGARLAEGAGERGERGAGGAEPEAGALELAKCSLGLTLAYLAWGLLQEKIMTTGYGAGGQRFGDSQLLVFSNRLLALGAGALALRASGRGWGQAPLYKLSFCALSNVVSAWSQYEALKFVSFPLQVLSKSSKTVAVLLLARLCWARAFPPLEYASAAAIAGGLALFLLSAHSAEPPHAAGGTSASGLLLLALYLASDSFTANWQGELFRAHGLAPLQMLCGVNLFSCVLTLAALLQSASTAASLALLRSCPELLRDVALMALSSACGQLLIYRTIERFGPVVFTIVMSLRQALSILLSCAVYGHPVTWWGYAGVALVFAAVLLRAYGRQRLRALQRRGKAPKAPKAGAPQ